MLSVPFDPNLISPKPFPRFSGRAQIQGCSQDPRQERARGAEERLRPGPDRLRLHLQVQEAGTQQVREVHGRRLQRRRRNGERRLRQLPRWVPASKLLHVTQLDCLIPKGLLDLGLCSIRVRYFVIVLLKKIWAFPGLFFYLCYFLLGTVLDYN